MPLPGCQRVIGRCQGVSCGCQGVRSSPGPGRIGPCCPAQHRWRRPERPEPIRESPSWLHTGRSALHTGHSEDIHLILQRGFNPVLITAVPPGFIDLSSSS